MTMMTKLTKNVRLRTKSAHKEINTIAKMLTITYNYKPKRAESKIDQQNRQSLIILTF